MSRTTLIALVLSLAGLAAIAGATPAAAAPLARSAQAAPQANGPSRTPLTRIYRGADGGALYLRQLGTEVYGFGEHPGLKYAYVLKGSISGDRINGSWWDVPKGTRAETGSLRLRWTQGGARIVRSAGDDLGPDVFTAIPPDGIPWPNRQAAGFQATSTGDLDGVFVGDDASRHYVRETSANTVWVAERPSQPGERPGWVSVFTGKRKAGGGFAGTYVDVPKGMERASGNFGAALIGSKRELALTQLGVQRARRLAPDYALNWNLFASGIAGQLDNRTVGYAYALAHDGAILRSGAGGVRRHAIDGGALPFTPRTKSQTASAAKLVSATAIVKALHDRGLDVDARIAPFLPDCLEQGPGVSTITFRQILNHTTGLPGARGSGTQESCNGRDPYECLLDILKRGREVSRDRAYNNKAYDLLRFLVPLVGDRDGAMFDFELFDCKNTAGILHGRIAERFARYVRHVILKPVGSDGSWLPSGEFSLTYNCDSETGRRCSPDRKGERMTAEYFLRSGSGKMAMSALDYVRFLSALDRGLIVPRSLVESMKTGSLGFDRAIGGQAGQYYWKNGGCPSLSNTSWGRGCATLAITFPGDVQAYVTINSSSNTYTQRLETILRNAFDNALR